MHIDKEKWNQKYRETDGDLRPSGLLTDFAHRIQGRYALDLACGNGRNSIYLSDKGFDVDAIDISDVAIDRIKSRHPRINAMCVDLDHWRIPPQYYDLIVNIKFLDRNLFPGIIEGLKPSGILLFESFVSQSPDAPFCLCENELLDAFRDLKIRFYEEVENDPQSRFEMTVRMMAVKK